ncbi:hypothetical protein JKA74_09320 [Marivirga sp. S37H4]|uniref:Ricin B lectin domain-containing protein n=1 Tax=Marivirga aurantiaca TaxID=2802615 RepID=A0A934WY02_9BACT|nr:hypothetical protein [Marivirga aurantiaca]MBK6265238.1 hypothetical protein [Marivirga aurantiaca]
MRSILSLLFIFSFLSLQAQTFQSHFKEASSAYKAEDYPQMLVEIKKAHALRPQHQTLIYYLAIAHSLNNHVDSANYWLRKVVSIDSKNYDIDKPDFENLLASEDFKRIKDYQIFMTEAKVRSDTALVIPDTELHIEGVAFDPFKRRILFSSINQKNIFSVEEGMLKPLFKKKFPLGITGMAVQDSILWFTGAGFAEAGLAEDDPEYESSKLYKADLKNAILLDSFTVADQQAHIFGDVILSPENKLLISDSKTNTVYRLENKKLIAWITTESILSLQGIAQMGQKVFLADYAGGLFSYDLSNQTTQEIIAPADLSLKGIDGLYTYKNGLVTIQNGVTPHRITYLQFNPQYDQVERFQYLEKNHPAMGEPTLGFIANQHLYYVANSFWGLNDKGQINNPEKIKPLILRLPLPEPIPATTQMAVLDYVKILDGREKEALYFYENNWASFRKYAMQHGDIENYKIMRLTAHPEYDLILETVYKDSLQYSQIEEVFQKWRKQSGGDFLNELKPNDFRKNVKMEIVKTYISSEELVSVEGRCSGSSYRAFDFWLGEWEVYSRDGRYLGHNRVGLIQNGCGLQENWQSANGAYKGTSYNFYNATAGQWHQSWVDNQGGSLQLNGSYENGQMQMQSDPEKQDQSRISWKLLEDGSVTQLWEQSRDKGKSWQEVFFGVYKKQ